MLKEKHKVYMAQVNYRYGDNVFLPYSVATLQAYAQGDSEIRANYEFKPPLFLRDDPDQVARTMDNPAVLGLSCYLWNWEYNKLLAQAVKAHHPNCLVVMGGIHVPEKSLDFFMDHDYADVLVHGEGEVSFAKILLALNSGVVDFSSIPGLSIRIGRDMLKTSPPTRISDLSKLPSPYLTGVFDSLMGNRFSWNASQETNRGCPYPCTFCAWGPAYQQKIWRFEEERILEELEWFGRHQIEYIFNCDANWGIFDRDYELTLKMAEIKAKHGGYPKKFRMCTAKNSNDRIFDITKVLDAAGMNKGATLSFQSMDDGVLEIVKRKNIKIKDFAGFMHRYREAKIATYTELIMGLPGETYETFKAGIDKLIDAGQHSGLNNYVCLMLPNDEMSDPEYVKRYQLKSVRMPILLAHSTPGADTVQEYQDVVVSTFSMSEEDWQKMFVFSWAIQCFHCLSLLQPLAVFMLRHFGIAPSSFYQELLDYYQDNPDTLIGRELSAVRKVVSGSVAGGRLDVVLPEFGNIFWPLEEASFLKFISKKQDFYQEVKTFIEFVVKKNNLDVNEELSRNIVSYCSAVVIDPFADSDLSVDLDYDLYNHFSLLYGFEEAVPPPLPKKEGVRLSIKPEVFYKGDLETYSREVVWYGRKGGKFQHTNILVSPITV